MFGLRYWNRVNIILAVIFVINYTSGDSDSPLLRRQKRIVGGLEAAKPPEDDPVVFINKNGRYARIYGSRDEHRGFYVFRGIRFGEPPVGRHRFQRPRKVQPEGNLNATKWGSPCPQPDREKVGGGVIGTEDCLFLNIFTPALADDEEEEGYPILVWIHGGGFRYGAACQYDMRNLMKMKMIVVSIQYRLGSLGFLSTGGKELPGNNGMFDMVLAVNWIREYIMFFGGNPKKIIAFGHGTGASSAMLLTLSKLTQNFFSGLIAMSGSALSHFAIDKDPMSSARSIASANNCPIEDATAMTRCLQELPVKNLIDADSALERIRTSIGGLVAEFGMLSPGPVVDGSDDERSLPNLLTEKPERFLELGKFPKIPLLTGIMKGETSGAVFGRYREELRMGKKVEEVTNLLNENLIKTLQSTVVHLTGENGSRHFVPEAFSNYLHIFEGISGKVDTYKVLNKVVQVTGDALFNVPAFVSSQLWSKKGKTYLYSFDHVANGRNFGKDLIRGSSSSSSSLPNEGVFGHGDDLGYIFGRNSIFGEQLTAADSGPIEPEAEEVIKTFTEMIGNFARHGEIFIPENQKLADGGFSKVQTFGGSDDTAKANPYVSVTSKLTPMNNFRYCEMGLWTGSVQRLRSTTCGLLKSSIDTVQRVNEKTVDLVEKISRESIGVGEKLGDDVFNSKKLGQPAAAAAANVGNIIQGLVPGLVKTEIYTDSKTVKPEHERNLYIRPKTLNIGNLIPARNIFG